MAINHSREHFEQIIDILTSYRDRDDVQALLEDLLSDQEIRWIGERWMCMKYITHAYPYRKISTLTGCSPSTITKYAKRLFDGKGGMKKALEDLDLL